MSSSDRDSWKNRILGIAMEQLQKAIVSGVRRGLMRLLRIIVFAIAGVIVLAAGILFLWVGFYYYLSTSLPPWVAWLIVGFTSMLLGLILLLAAYLTR
ncbi:MAG: hypothetical protein QXR65_08540 [Candidatus Bathyarchaeia archaeon]|nr:hypothetical protein [Candidatus Bathyarchaeota archaeon]